MSCLVIELNDSAIGVATGDEVFVPEPGYALSDGDTLTMGAAALACARVRPQWVTNRYWDTLDQDTLPDEGRWRQTPAELAFVQLEDIWKRRGQGVASAMLVVPASFTQTQLGLILGMCRKAAIPVVSLIDAAVAALSRPPAGRQAVYLDITLHRVIATRCLLQGSLARDGHAELDQFGLTSFMGKWAAAVADACVRVTRYDPMHSAEAEQQLYDALPGLLSGLQKADSVTHQVSVNGEIADVPIPRAALVQAVKPFYGRIIGLIEELVDEVDREINVVLSSRYAAFPGLVDDLADVRAWSISMLPQDAALRGVTEHLSAFEQPAESIGLIIERPVTVSSAPEPPAPDSNLEAQTPTHILADGEAYVLAARPFVIGTAIRDGSWGYRASGAVRGVSRSHCSICMDNGRATLRDHSTYGTYLNGQRIEGERRLAAGDVVRVGNPGVELRLVREVVCDG